MIMSRLVGVALALLALPALAQVSGAQQPSITNPPTLDFDFFKARIEPIFTTKRVGNARCISCHGSGTPMRLKPLPDGAATWSDADARANFDVIRARVIPGDPDDSRLLRHPLAEAAGGDPQHDGGKHWTSKDDPEWQTLAAWARGATLASAPPVGQLHARIIQTNSAGDNVHIIDPATNKVVGEIRGHRGRPRRRGGARRQPHLREQRVELDARRRRRAHAARDDADSAQRASEQHRGRARTASASTSRSAKSRASSTSSTPSASCARRASRSRAPATTRT